MNKQELQLVLETGMVGHVRFTHLLEYLNPYYADNFATMPTDLLAKGVTAARWEQNNDSPSNGLWRSYLVLTLNADFQSLPTEAPLTDSLTLEQVHTIAVEICGCLLYEIRGCELWLEYPVATEQTIAEMERVMENGRVGAVPFPVFLKINGPWQYTPWHLASRFGMYGVTKVRWVPGTQIPNLATRWEAHLVARLSPSSFATPPSLPSKRLVDSMLAYVSTPSFRQVVVTGNDLEVWLLYRVELPLSAEDKQILQAYPNTITEE